MKAVNVDDVLKILYKYGEYIFMTDEKRYSCMVDEVANLKSLEQGLCDKCVYSTKDGYCQYDDIAEVMPTDDKSCDDFLSREERLKMLMEMEEFDFLKDIPPDKIWKLVFMLEFIGDAENEEE